MDKMRLWIEKWFTTKWYQTPMSWMCMALLPFSWLFHGIVTLRRYAYQREWFASSHPHIPVIVVGNITIAGTGKTSFVLWLVDWLKTQDFRPGIVSRGVGGKIYNNPLMVTEQLSVHETGDEAILLAKRSGVPVVICRDRVRAADYLVKHTSCNIIVSDDGLQHYRLRRDVEIVLIDAKRQFGNQQLLPAGPLRESIKRINEVDFVVSNGRVNNITLQKSFVSSIDSSLQTRQPVVKDCILQSSRSSVNRRDKTFLESNARFTMQYRPSLFVSVLHPEITLPVSAFNKTKVHAVTGLGHPEQFFTMLQEIGLIIIPHVFPDHHLYEVSELAWMDDLPIIMTEKDAVKCNAFANKRFWYLAIDCDIDARLQTALAKKLR